MTVAEMVITGAVVAIAALLTLRSIVIIRPHERGVVERMGKYNRTLGSGMNLIIPWMETVRKVDMRETLIDVPAQEVITQDNVGVAVDAVIYFQVVDPFKVIYNVANFEDAAIKLAQTNLRNIMGDMKLDETLVSRDKINMTLRQILDDATDRWGVRVTRVEIQKIEPPSDITEAMSRQMKAERTKRAAILEAEGIKRSEILRAEGDKVSAVLRAEGEAKSIKAIAVAERDKKRTVADGEAQAIKTVFGAMHDGRPTNDILTLKYLESLEKIAQGSANKIFLPLETTGILGGVAALGEAFKSGRGKKAPRLEEGKESTEAGEEEKTE